MKAIHMSPKRTFSSIGRKRKVSREWRKKMGKDPLPRLKPCLDFLFREENPSGALAAEGP
jgi:hypothetical protein